MHILISIVPIHGNDLTLCCPAMVARSAWNRKETFGSEGNYAPFNKCLF